MEIDDPNLLSTIILEKQEHMKEWHPEACAPAAVGGARPVEVEEYNAIIAPQNIPAGIDDRNKQLHPARFLAPPLDYEVNYEFMPVEVKNPNLHLKMGYIGVNVKDSKIIKSICNRASDRNDKLDKFSDKNIKISQRIH